MHLMMRAMEMSPRGAFWVKMGASKEESKNKVTEYKTHLPVCKVCFPPDNTPSGRVPVGVRPLSVNTLSLSSLVHKNKTQARYTHMYRLQFSKQASRHLVVVRLFLSSVVPRYLPCAHSLYAR